MTPLSPSTSFLRKKTCIHAATSEYHGGPLSLELSLVGEFIFWNVLKPEKFRQRSLVYLMCGPLLVWRVLLCPITRSWWSGCDLSWTSYLIKTRSGWSFQRGFFIHWFQVLTKLLLWEMSLPSGLFKGKKTVLHPIAMSLCDKYSVKSFKSPMFTKHWR